MSWSRCLLLLLLAGNSWAAGEFVIAGGVEGDTADGLALALFGDVAIGDETWLSGGVARSSVDLEFRDELETWYADIGVDHYFDPAGIRASVAYWGDDDILDSVDLRTSLYFRGDKGSLSFDYEFRDFDLELPDFDIFRSRQVSFDANGIGVAVRLDLTDKVDLRLKGIAYDYSVDLRLDPNRDIVNVISVSRLSLINSLVDYRANVGLGIDFGLKRLEFDIAQWEGAVAGARTNSYTLHFLTPVGDRNDIEFGIGYDDSGTYGQVTVFSIYLYFYGT